MKQTIGIYIGISIATLLATACQDKTSVPQPAPENEMRVVEPVEISTSNEVSMSVDTIVNPGVVEAEGLSHGDIEDVDHVAIARGRLAAGLVQESINELEMAIFDDPDSFEAFYLMGQAFNEQGDQSMSIWSYQEASLLRPEDRDVLRTLTQLQLDSGDAVGAEVTARTIIKLDRSDPNGYRLLARSFSKRDMWNETIDSNNKALELGDDSAYTWNNKGYAELVLGQYPDAVESFQTAVSLPQATHFMWNNLGLSLEKDNRLLEAHNAYSRALEVSAKYVNAKLNLQRVSAVAAARGIAIGDRVAKLPTGAADPVTEASVLIEEILDSE